MISRFSEINVILISVSRCYTEPALNGVSKILSWRTFWCLQCACLRNIWTSNCRGVGRTSQKTAPRFLGLVAAVSVFFSRTKRLHVRSRGVSSENSIWIEKLYVELIRRSVTEQVATSLKVNWLNTWFHAGIERVQQISSDEGKPRKWCSSCDWMVQIRSPRKFLCVKS